MFTTLVSVALFSTLAIQGAHAQSFSIDTPAIVQCQPVTVTWTSTNNPPYNLAVVDSADPCGDPIDDLGDFYGTSTNWTVNVASGTSVTFSLMDSQGQEAWSGDMIVGGSGDASCLNASSSASSVASSAASSAASSDASSASADASAASSSGASVPAAAEAKTTLYVPGTTGATPTRSASASSSSGAVPVGAANAGLNPNHSGAYSVREFSTPIMVLSAIAAIALSL